MTPEEKGQFHFGLGFFILLIIAWGISNNLKNCSSKDSTSSPQQPGGASDAQQSTAAAQQEIFKVGDVVNFDDSQWSVVASKNNKSTLKSNNPFKPDAFSDGGTFITVKFKVKNLTAKEERIIETPVLKDDKGREFGHLDDAMFYLPKNAKIMTLEALPSGITKTYYDIYEIAGDVKTIYFEARSLSPFPDKKLILLCDVQQESEESQDQQSAPTQQSTHESSETPKALQNSQESSEATRAQQSAAESESEIFQVGDEVRFDDSEWSVEMAKNTGDSLKSGNEFKPDAVSDGGMFITVQFRVKNLTSKEQRIIDTPKLKDDRGREFGHIDDAIFYLPAGAKIMTLEALPSGITKTYYDIYEIAGDVKTIYFEARSLSAFPDKKLILLGNVQ